jgi:hypothetical protein
MEPTAKLEFDPRLQLPNHALFIGASQSGKTQLCLHLIRTPRLFNPKPKRIVFYYDQFQNSYLEAKCQLSTEGVELLLVKGCQDLTLEGIPRNPAGQTLVIIDDFSEETSSSNGIARIATNGRHQNISLWCVWHSLFSKHPASRVICQNIRWFFFLPSLRLESQLRTFGAQLGMKNLLLWAYAKCQEEEGSDFRYLLVDAGPRTPKLLRLRSHIHELSLQYCYT